MPLSSDLVGSPLPEEVVTVTPRMALAYSAGIGDDADATFDDANRERFCASPFYCVSLEWRIVVASRAERLGIKAEEAVRAVHAGQSTSFLRPIVPGRRVRISGQIVEIRATRAGALSRTQLTLSDAESGETLTETISTGIYRGVSVVGPDRAVSGVAPPVEAKPVSAARDVEEIIIPIDRWFPHRYTECAAIWNPIHTERTVALAAGLPDIIVHGTALWALAGRTLVTRFAPNAPQRLRSLSGRFAAMVIPGTPITVRYGRSDRDVLFSVINDRGEEAVTAGHAVFE